MIQSSGVTTQAPYSGRGPALRRRVLLLAAAIAFAGGVVAGSTHRPAAEGLAERYVHAWAQGDWARMYGMLTADARARTSLEDFRAAHEEDAVTATATGLRAGGEASSGDGVARVPVTVETRMFGALELELVLPVADEDDEARVAWARHVAFPGVREGERLERTTRLPTRGTLVAADGTVLARGDERTPEDPALSATIVGSLGPIPEERAEELRARGVPDDAQVGVSGLERALDDELRGLPGGVLRAGDRRLASAEPVRADPVRTSIIPRVQMAAVAAIGPRLGGIVAMDPETGRIRAAAGIGLSGLQPPGSTFKIVTLAGALEAGITRPSKSYPVETFTTLEGVRLENANGEACGGTLIETFAHSCNSVFAPMGAELGARRLVEAAEAFGFNAPPGIDGAATSTIPPPDEIGDDLAVGASAIGQGRVQATALQMAIAAATIAEGGVRVTPTLLAGTRGDRERVVPERVARVVARGMRAVVEEGTGTAAAVPGIAVAGKTGTAELRSTVAPPPGADGTEVAPQPADDPTDTDAWFAAYAPARDPRIAVGVLLVESGSGGATAAPAARVVLEAMLG